MVVASTVPLPAALGCSEPEEEARIRTASFLLAAFVTLAAAACGDGSEGGGDVVPSDDGGDVITPSPQDASAGCTPETATDLSGDDPFSITAQGFRWAPDCVRASGAASITVVNEDAVDHTFTIPGTQVDAPLPGNETFNGESAGLEPGTYEFLCTIHPTMTGTIIVV
jgi:plastocyanin